MAKSTTSTPTTSTSSIAKESTTTYNQINKEAVMSNTSNTLAVELFDRLHTEVPVYKLENKRYPNGKFVWTKTEEGKYIPTIQLVKVGTKTMYGRAALYNLRIVIMHDNLTNIKRNLDRIHRKEWSLIPNSSNQSYMYTKHTKKGKEITMFNMELVFAENWNGSNDPAREASLSFRINETSSVIDIITVEVCDFEADGQSYFQKNGRLHNFMESLDSLQITGLELKDNDIKKDGVILKGLAIVDDSTIFPKDSWKNSDLKINHNVIKLGKKDVGTKFQVLLIRQGNSLETKKNTYTEIQLEKERKMVKRLDSYKDMKITMQSALRMMQVMTPEGWERFLSSVNTMGDNLKEILKSGDNAYHAAFNLDGAEDIDIIGVAEELYRNNLPIAVQTTDKILTTVLKNNLFIKDKAYRVYATTNPNMKGLNIKVNIDRKREHPIGSIVELKRDPTLGTEWISTTVIGYTDKGIEVSQDIMDRATGDTDGDFFTVLKNQYIDVPKYNERWETMSKFYNGLMENSLNIKDVELTVLDAILKIVKSNSSIGSIDNRLTNLYVDNNCYINDAVLSGIEDVQACVDSQKKNIEIKPVNKVTRPAFYDLMGGKYESISEFNELVLKTTQEVTNYTGRLKELVLALLKAIPVVIIPSQTMLSTKSYTWYEKAWLKNNNTQENINLLRPEYIWGPGVNKAKAKGMDYFNNTSPEVVRTAEILIKKYKKLGSDLVFSRTDLEKSDARKGLNQLYIDMSMTSNPVIKEAMTYITKNILCGNPTKLIASEKALVTMPLLKNHMEFFTKWQTYTQYTPKYFISTLYVNLDKIDDKETEDNTN